MYSYAVLDRHSTRKAGGHHGQIAAARYVLGIDVKPAALAELCNDNLIPHRRDGRVITAAIELAQTWSLPRPGSLLVAVRANPDTIGAMALLEMRADNVRFDTDAERRIDEIARASGAESVWEPGSDGSVTPLQALRVIVGDRGLLPSERVAAARAYIVRGTFLGVEQGSARVSADWVEQMFVHEQVRSLVGGRVATIRSPSRFALTMGLKVAPVVIVEHPGEGAGHRKVIVCQASSGYVDLTAVSARLAQMEHGWHDTNSNTIVSPEGRQCALNVQRIVLAVASCLLDPPNT